MEDLSQELPRSGEACGVALSDSSSRSQHTRSSFALDEALPTILPQESRQHGEAHIDHSRALSTRDGFALVVGLQIGSGVFASPAYVALTTGSTFGAILVWMLSGLLVWAGASTLLEFATMFPSNGGIVQYLFECYGECLAFLFTLVWISIAKPCANALISVILAEHVFQIFYSDVNPRSWGITIVALVAMNGMTIVNMAGTVVGARAANIFLIVKLSSVAAIVMAALVYELGHNGSSHQQPQNAHAAATPLWQRQNSEVESLSFSNLSSAMFTALFAFGGWENLGFIAGEVRDPTITLPKILHMSMCCVICVFIALNIAILSVISRRQLEKTDAVAVIFGRELFGISGGIIFAVTVVISCLGALNANIFAAARLTQEASMRGFLPATFKRSSHQMRALWTIIKSQSTVPGPENFPSDQRLKSAPIHAMALNAAIANGYILVGTFRSLVVFKGMAEYTFYAVTMAGIFVLRASMPSSKEYYRTRTWNPIIFCVGSSILVLQLAVVHPRQASGIPFVLVIGLITYLLLRLWRARPKNNTAPEHGDLEEHEQLTRMDSDI